MSNSLESPEIDEGAGYIGYHAALELVIDSVRPIGIEEIKIFDGTGRITAEEIIAKINNPTYDVSLKDGFAVRSADVASASFTAPVRLRVIGNAFAGVPFTGVVPSGTAVSICSGSPIPPGADAVVSIEFCMAISPDVLAKADAEPGRNILRAGEDIRAGSTIVDQGNILLPGVMGLIAAAGIDRIKVFRKPEVAIIAIGDEVVAPGSSLKPGQLYASNMVTTGAWLDSFGIPFRNGIIGDDKTAIRREILSILPHVDAIITSGGAWGSERDMVAGVLDELGWQKLFHHVRMGPGKGIVFGLLKGKPVFCLPGGPASNEMAFLQFALPGILHISGYNRNPLPIVSAILTEDIKGRHPKWTEFKDAILSQDKNGNYTVTPYRDRSRLQAIARTNCLICLPEGKKELLRGDIIAVQVLAPSLGGLATTF